MSDCIIFKGYKNPKGYGIVASGRHKDYAHRIAYAKSIGVHVRKIDGILIRHTCDNPSCVNPEHLVLGDCSDNMRDKVERGRQAKGEDFSSAKLTEAAVLDIRQNYVKNSRVFGLRNFAEKYGCSVQVIHAALIGKNWSHI